MEFTIFDLIIIATVFICEVIRHKPNADAEYKKFCEEFCG